MVEITVRIWSIEGHGCSLPVFKQRRAHELVVVVFDVSCCSCGSYIAPFAGIEQHVKVYLRAAARRLGMKCKAVLAPRADEFKVTLQARHCSRRFIENFAVLHLALEAQLEAHCYNLRQKAQIEFDKQVRLFNSGASDRRQAPKPPGHQAGQRTAVAKEIRRHGRLMLSPKVVVFGLGRGDLRHVF